MAFNDSKKPRLLSGIQPTGNLHLGNYLGAIIQFVEQQKGYECFYMVADLHALTTNPDPTKLASQTLDVVRWLLAAGIDPNSSTLFIQSHLHEHTELAWILGNYTAFGELARMTQFKEKSAHHELVSVGLFNYPVLMAADILLYQAEQVPVGEDQIQHLELARSIARRFNRRHGTIFLVPEPLLTKQARVMALNDPSKKMSKSFPASTISLSDSPDVITSKIMSAVTDTTPAKTSISPGVANLFSLAEVFVEANQLKDLKDRYHTEVLRYKDLKEALAEGIIAHMRPLQDKARSISDREILDVISGGAKRARSVAFPILSRVKKAVGLIQ